jgi:hypothetical protein
MANVLLILHIIGVAIWLGGNAVLAFMGPRTASAPADVRIWWEDAQGAMARVLYNVAGILVLVTGVAMVLNDQAEFSDMFVGIGFLAIIIGAVLGMAVFGPGSRKLSASIAEGDAAAAASITTRLTAFGIIDTLVIVVTIVAMVSRW